MKVNEHIKRSLSNQVVYLFGISIACFILGTIVLFYIQYQANQGYIEERQKIVNERNLLIQINDLFNTTFIDMGASTTLANPLIESQLYSQQDEIERLIESLETSLENGGRDITHANMVRDFSNEFYSFILPSFLEVYESGNQQQLDKLSNNIILPEVKTFRNSMQSSIMSIGKALEQNVQNLTQNQTYIQVIFILFILLFLFTLQRIVKRVFTNIGQPLSEFANAANEIAEGKEAVIKAYPNRKDELGTLSIAFEKMITTLQVKEQDLIAQNEELMAQQEELQAGQDQLQETLSILMDNEEKLTRSNALINGISTSLDKKDVLYSIVVNMCKITFSDCGLITFLHEDAYSSFGVSETGVQQFRNNLDSGLIQRLLNTRKAFVVKRQQETSEKGYHEATNYITDLYIPIITANQDIEAIMVYSRLGNTYSEKETVEYQILTKQIAISLEKIKLYERSEEERIINQDILNTVQEGIQLIDENRNILQINHEFSEMFECIGNTNEIIGLSWSDWSSTLASKIEDEQFIPSLDQAISYASRDNHVEPTSFIYHMKQDSRVIQVYCKKMFNGEKETGTIIVHRDITKEFEVDQMKSEFVSTVSHELRTPLASVLGFTELLLHKELKPERKTKYLKTIFNEAQRLSALINDFLDIQRMESGKQTYDKKFINIVPILEKVIEHQQVQTLIHQIHLSIGAQQTRILGDKSRIEQVFGNLLNNAIKYSPKGGDIVVRIREDENSLKIDFKDEGLGIPNDAIPHLFEKFYRIDNTDHRHIGGTGLGLSIVSEIVKIHDGSISVDSELGKGSVFTLTFPKIILEDMKNSEKNVNIKQHHNVVIIEDDKSLADLLSQELIGNGFQVSCFNNGSTALKQMKISPPDALVLDIKLEENELDGWAIMEEMKKDDKLKDIPIFISSAFDEKQRGYSLGAQDYLLKPYSPSKLSNTIMQTLLVNGKHGQIMIPKEEV
ncbi:response regulator receiver domain-containing protein [Ureibacillus xyleni]|uniref:histidine kinase n=1 Tax=Ureibacillus xyleni TaxID=614648 RepID=A0A285SNW8_9BACL|nr:ATP-binding protein [Ureibacillus xyleni]SOC09509.1 response regulator receiver domain-containing protein [Ureibacillus xyleni]